MKHLLVAGARPNFMKIAPILRELWARDEDVVLVHTGQHYDAEMSTAFFRELEIPEPDHYLEVGSASHAEQTARVMSRFEPVLTKERPDWVVVVGDVNSTLACGLVAVKLKHELGCSVAHVEAGLRSHDWRMPEEINRVLTDRLADLLLTTVRAARDNLVAEGIDESRIVFAGNVMIDTLMHQLKKAREDRVVEKLGLPGEFAVVTLHRPSNVDEPERLRELLAGLGRIADDLLPVVFPVHPRTRGRVAEFGLEELLEPLIVTKPLSYRAMIGLLDGARVVLTDSGGIQEETTVLGVPCLTLRENTERPVTLEAGTNRLLSWPPTASVVFDEVRATLKKGRLELGEVSPEGWDGRASARVVDALLAGRSHFG